MKFEYMLTFADYDAAIKLHRRKHFKQQISWIFMFRIMPVFSLFALVFMLVAGFMLRNGFVQNPPGLLIVPIFFLLLPIIYRKLIQKQFNQTFPPSARRFSIDISDEGIICVNPGVSESKFSWNAIFEYAQDEKITMFYISKVRFLFFPVLALSQAQQAELNALITRHMVKRQPC